MWTSANEQTNMQELGLTLYGQMHHAHFKHIMLPHHNTCACGCDKQLLLRNYLFPQQPACVTDSSEVLHKNPDKYAQTSKAKF